MRNPAFIVAGTNSSAGKTVITLGLMEALRRRGLTVQPFKAGPDYIDPGYHRALLGVPSYNLDTWMMGKKGVKRTFLQKSSHSQVSIIEGVMGLFDGKDGKSEEGSTAHIAKLLDIPVLLVVNAEKTARSAGAIIKGFESYDPKVNIKWVVFNRVGSPRHFQILKDSIPKGSKIKVLGYLPKDLTLSMPERHLGLVMAGELEDGSWKQFVKSAGDAIEKSVDIKALIGRPVQKAEPVKKEKNRKESTRIAVALDKAFCFYYEENFEILKNLGAELVFFSPVKDKQLPQGTSGIYLGGGYPELYASSLEENLSLKSQIKSASKKGMPIYAECGGLMYLGRNISDKDGKVFQMSGVLPFSTRMLSKRKALGYREVLAEGFPVEGGAKAIRGHEFHYSEIIKVPKNIKTVFSFNHDGNDFMEGYLYKNTLASYIHLHFSSNPGFACGFVNMCKKFKTER
ncbi:MAG: cobyrinate a,c-diamide synthase [Deltaproteobacteria bacterium]|nr:cobyrinate a,c-diamide synthase [Deltaproteobacteria bacterium]